MARVGASAQVAGGHGPGERITTSKILNSTSNRDWYTTTRRSEQLLDRPSIPPGTTHTDMGGDGDCDGDHRGGLGTAEQRPARQSSAGEQPHDPLLPGTRHPARTPPGQHPPPQPSAP